MPKRIQRQRTQGWQMTSDAFYVGRPTKWGNPFVPLKRVSLPAIELGIVGAEGLIEVVASSVEQAVAWYRVWILQWLHRTGSYESYLLPVRGRDLACCCPLDKPCHADVLLELSNRD